MPLYVIRAGESGPCKIGLAGDVADRLYTLQNGHYETLRLLHVFEGGRKEEHALHRRFASALLIREWFAPIPEILAGDFGLPRLPLPVMAAAEKAVVPRAPKGQGSTDTRVGRIVQACGGSGTVCRTLDVPMNTVTYWSIRDSIPAKFWGPISSLSGGKVSLTDLAALRAKKKSDRGTSPVALTNTALSLTLNLGLLRHAHSSDAHQDEGHQTR